MNNIDLINIIKNLVFINNISYYILSFAFFKGLNYGVDFKGGTLIEIGLKIQIILYLKLEMYLINQIYQI